MVELRHVTAGYGEKAVLHDLTLAFPPGSFTAILGPNGCGKSTLLKCAAGLLTPFSGTAAAPAPRARNVAYLPQSRPLPEMTALQLALHGRFPWLRWPRQYRERDYALARAALERLGIAGYADSHLSALSGGTRQKVYLAMALTQDAPTILLDEPTAFLDIGCQLELMKLCRELASEGRAVAAVLHDLPLALAHADRVAVLEEGRLVFTGSPDLALQSCVLDRVFGIRVLQTDTPAGMQYICVPNP